MKCKAFLEVDVDYDVTPAEKPSQHCPGHDAGIDINTVTLNGNEIPWEWLSDKDIEDIEASADGGAL